VWILSTERLKEHAANALRLLGQLSDRTSKAADAAHMMKSSKNPDDMVIDRSVARSNNCVIHADLPPVRPQMPALVARVSAWP
jgi:hypothetical protein